MDAANWLRDLIDVAQSGSPEDSDVGDATVMCPKKDPADEPPAIALIDVELAMRRRRVEAAADDVPSDWYKHFRTAAQIEATPHDFGLEEIAVAKDGNGSRAAGAGAGA